MAETLLAVGLVCNVIQFIDLGTKVVQRLDEYRFQVQEAPKAFKEVHVELPLLLDTLGQTKNQIERGNITVETEKALTPVVDGCITQIRSLDDLIQKIVVEAGDSSWQRSRKALASLATEKKAQSIRDRLRGYIQVLTFYQTTSLSTAKLPAEGRKQPEPVFTVPFERDPRYIDRLDITLQLEAKLRKNHRAALAGIGGVGKTQIAIEFCYKFREQDPSAHVFWVHASTASRVDQAYKKIARKLNLPGWDDLSLNTFEIVSEWFNEHSGWLLIFDNADDIDLFFGNPTEMSRQKQMHEYIPRCEDGTTIITTRDKRVAYRLSDREDPILVAPMNEKDAGALLRSRTAQQGYFPANSTDDAQLLEALGNIPLAITQAAAFITENNITVAEYLQILHTNQAEVEDLLSEELGDQRRYSESASSILNTLKLSFDQIIAKKPLAADILSLMAFLDRNGIPKTLLQRDNIRNIDFVSALGTLQNFSLIGAQRGGADFEMHRLVQLSLQRWLRGSREKWQCEVIAVLSQRFPVGDYVNWKECEKLSPHAQTVLAYTDASEQGTLQRAQILYNLARFDGEQSRYQMAEQRFAEAVKMRQEVLGVDNPETLKSMSYLGEVLFREGKYSEAGSVLRTVIAENTKRLGPEAEETLYNTGSLAEVVQGEGKFSEAEELFRTALKGEGRCLGDVHVMKIADSLGAVLRDQKKFNDSEYWIRKSLAGRERLLGNDHLETLRSVNHLALLLSMMGRLEEAEQMARRAVSGSEAAMGRDHHLTFMSVHTHGKILRLQGRYDAATEQCRRALDGFIKVLGPENRGTLRCLQSLAFIEEAQGSYSEAERLLQQVVDGNIKTLGSDHQHTLDSVNDLKRVSTLYNRQKSQPSND